VCEGESEGEGGTDISATGPREVLHGTVDQSSGQVGLPLLVVTSLGVTKCETKKGEGVGFRAI